MKGIKMYTRIQKKIPQNTECQHLTVFMAFTFKIIAIFKKSK